MPDGHGINAAAPVGTYGLPLSGKTPVDLRSSRSRFEACPTIFNLRPALNSLS